MRFFLLTLVLVIMLLACSAELISIPITTATPMESNSYRNLNCDDDSFIQAIIEEVVLQIPVTVDNIQALASRVEISNDSVKIVCEGNILFSDFSMLRIKYSFDKNDLSLSFELIR
ncbi:MAG TPA: hypothetical protein QF601_04235 [Dehalococcoidia bacterium]|nr:hypothetical protein [Dehalococcoidia bacterium]